MGTIGIDPKIEACVDCVHTPLFTLESYLNIFLNLLSELYDAVYFVRLYKLSRPRLAWLKIFQFIIN